MPDSAAYALDSCIYDFTMPRALLDSLREEQFYAITSMPEYFAICVAAKLRRD